MNKLAERMSIEKLNKLKKKYKVNILWSWSRYNSYLNDITFLMLEPNVFLIKEKLSSVLYWKYELEEFNENKIINYINQYLNLEHSVIFIETSDLEITDKDTLLSCHSITGYSGGGKKMIAEYEDNDRNALLDSPRQYGITQVHKHIPEMQKITGIDNAPIFCPIVSNEFYVLNLVLSYFFSFV